MPSKQVVPDEALSAALGMYAGMVGQVLNNPRRWLGSTRTRALSAGLPARVLDAVRDRARGDVTPASPHWAAQPDSKRVEWWIRRIERSNRTVSLGIKLRRPVACCPVN